ncbi:uncharacterized protein LOC113848388 [Abrus precatorius]|uniref:Uncharacterized protein LOC113848388 n=1 Tax=Abrus precatorius TaxID=3816 RepID=A0A8B8JQE1_ABRPR|nr:uncharacterized protein LOC113848388 [Abrus precatorius]
MERSNPPKPNNDELAIVKAAAWAWHQHGSDSKGKNTGEFDATITHHAPGPSRYKLEAMRMDKESKEGSSIHSNKLSLLDAYEVQSISRHLNSLIESSKGVDNSTNVSFDIGGGRVKKKKIRKGFWLRHGVVCGREEDVVNPRALRNGSQVPAKQVPVVDLVKCLPMANGDL